MMERETESGNGMLRSLLITSDSRPRPGLLLAPTFAGRNAFAVEKARALAELGYACLIVDVYGEGRSSQDPVECRAWMKPLMDDRILLRDRMRMSLEALRACPEVDSQKNVAAVGFCFGGLCVLDLARSGAGVAGVVSFHGLLGAPSVTEKISAKVLVLHGYDDPMAKPEQLTSFATEMTEAGADWQVHAYGHTMHSFTNKKAANPAGGTQYNADADRRSWTAMKNFLDEIFTEAK